MASGASTAEDHHDPALIRPGVRSWVDSVLGEHVRKAIFVEVLPMASEMEHWPQEDRARRGLSFRVAVLGIVVIALVLLETVCLVMNFCISGRPRLWSTAGKRRRQAKARSARVMKRNGYNDEGAESLTKYRRVEVAKAVPTDESVDSDSEKEETEDTDEVNVEEIGADAEDELEETRMRVSGYVPQDLYFAAYHSFYGMCCLAVTGFALRNDFLSQESGLDYEFYLLWVLYIVGLQLVCLLHVFRHALRLSKDVPSPWMSSLKAFDPFGGHVGLLRDAVTSGIYAQELVQRFRAPDSLGYFDGLLATITLVSAWSIFLPNVWIFMNVYPLRDFQETYWPSIIQADRKFTQLQGQPAAPQAQKPKYRGCLARLFQQASAPIKDFLERPDKFAVFIRSILSVLDSGTREHKQASSLLGDLPQVVCGAIFLMRYEGVENATFVAFSTSLSLFQIVLVLLMRTPTLWWMTSCDMEWSHVTARDISCGACRYGSKESWPVRWTLQSRACRLLLRNPETTVNARIQALKSLHELHTKEYQKDPDQTREERDEDERKDEEERMEARHAVLWEVVHQADPRIQRYAKEFLDVGSKDPKDKADWRAAAVQLKRLIDEVPSDKIEAMKLLSTKYPQFSPAYAKTLQQELCKRTTRRRSRACPDRKAGDGDEEDESDAAVKEQANQQEHHEIRQEWRSTRDVRFASAKALAHLADLASQSESGGRHDEKEHRLTEEQRARRRDLQRSMALKAIKSVAPAVVDCLDGTAEVEINSAALVVVTALRTQEEMELAIDKSMQILKGKAIGMKEARKGESWKLEERRKIAEIVLVQLVPELEPQRPDGQARKTELRGQEYWLDEIVSCAFDLHFEEALRWPRKRKSSCSSSSSADSASSGASGSSSSSLMSSRSVDAIKAASCRVLERLGGHTAAALKERLLKRDLGLAGTDLLQVLETQDQDLQVTGGDWRLCRTMNLILALRGDAQRSRLDESDFKRVAQGEEVFEVLARKELAFQIPTSRDPGDSEDHHKYVLPVFFTDLEPDDIMFIAEMWRFLRQERKGRTCCEPLVIFAADLADKDAGMIFEKKLLLAALLLGKVDCRIVTPSPKVQRKKKEENVDHNKMQRMAALRDQNVKAIQERLRRFKGAVEFFVCAPARGNLGEIVHGPDPLKEDFMRELLAGKTCSVALYSGQFNVKNMEVSDMEALLHLLRPSKDKKDTNKKHSAEALVDVSKFTFWGGPEAHKTTGGLSTFALPNFAPKIKCLYPEIAFVWSAFDSEFNKKLVHYDGVFEKEVFRHREAELKGLYEAGRINEYALGIVSDELLFSKVVPKKRLTLKNLAYGCCDAPLCDQLIFAERWAFVYQPFTRLWEGQKQESWEPSWVGYERGKWQFDKIQNHTAVDPKSTQKEAPNGTQPVVQYPCNILAIYRISEALQEYTFGQLQELRSEKQHKVTPDKAKQAQFKLFS